MRLRNSVATTYSRHARAPNGNINFAKWGKPAPMASDQVKRKLAAILAADIAGYSRLMGADEAGTLARLKEYRRELIDPRNKQYRGRVVKTTGDGILVEFPSIVDAVCCAIDVQHGMLERNADIPPEKRIEFRVGVNLGDVIIEGRDLYGDGVNIAARLEGLAEPGGICISQTVFNHTRGKITFGVEDLGEQSLKNIVQPIHVYRVVLKSGRGSATSRSQEPAPVLPDKPSIAVLPFQNMSDDPGQEYFVDGLVEDVITALSRMRWLFVIARNSSFTYKGRTIDVKRVGRELGVRYVLEGSVRKAANRLRITGQLIDTATGNHIWADRFDGALEDIFDLQDKIAASVAGAIEPKLRQAEIERAQTKPTENLTAYDLYLRALALVYILTKESHVEALALLERAIASDRQYSSAYGLAAHCLQFCVIQRWAVYDDVQAQCLRMARLAIETGRDDPQALAMGGFTIAFFGRNHEEGLAQIERALALNPNAAQAWANGGWMHCWLAEQEKSIEYFEKAIRLSPFDPLVKYLCHAGIGHAHFFTGRSDEAIAWADKALSERPNFVPSLRLKLAAATMADRPNEAQEALRRLRAADPGVSVASLMRIHPSRPQSQRDYYAAALRKAGLPD